MYKYIIAAIGLSLYCNTLSCFGFETYEEAFKAGKAKQKTNSYKQAIKDFTMALKLTRQLKNIAITRYEIAQTYLKNREYEKAREFYKKTQETPKIMEYLSYRARVGEGKCLFYMKQYPEAIKVLSSCAEYTKTHSKSHTYQSKLLLGKIYYFQKKYSKAVEVYKSILAENNLHEFCKAETSLNLGLSLFFQKKYSEAQKYFDFVCNDKTGKRYFGGKANKYSKICRNRLGETK